MEMYMFEVVWKARTHTGYRPTAKSAARARLELIRWLRETDPKVRTVQVRG